MNQIGFREGDDSIRPSDRCYCGGHVAWVEYKDRWDGACYGACGSYLTKYKAIPGGRDLDRLMNQLIERRHRLELTQLQLAERMGVRQQDISKLERQPGDRRAAAVFEYARAVGAEFSLSFDADVSSLRGNGYPRTHRGHAGE